MAALKEYDISRLCGHALILTRLVPSKSRWHRSRDRPQREILPTLQTVARSFRRLNAVQQTRGPWEDYGRGSVDYGTEDRGRGK
jgi:hypothetical protein